MQENFSLKEISSIKAATTDMTCSVRSKLSRSLVHLKIFGFDMTTSFQVRILILSREVEHLFWVWINSEKSLKQQLFSVNYETSHNLTYSFLELFVFFWITFVNIFLFLTTKKILYVNTFSKGNQSWNKNKEQRYIHFYLLLILASVSWINFLKSN